MFKSLVNINVYIQKSLLDAAGIENFIKNENPQLNLLSSGLTWTELLVKESELEEAREVLSKT